MRTRNKGHTGWMIPVILGVLFVAVVIFIGVAFFFRVVRRTIGKHTPVEESDTTAVSAGSGPGS
ncbi:MAG TPA: hypothetical protein VEV82_07440 [Actinomycetota bacterium]|nr:hypothetical protein [Actinomycetota bacterium]